MKAVMYAAAGTLTSMLFLSLLTENKKMKDWKRMMQQEEDDARTWMEVVEVMLCKKDVGEDVILVPDLSSSQKMNSGDEEHDAENDSECLIPEFFKTHHIFALTAFNPPGECYSDDQNAAANEMLWKEIQKLEMDYVWPTWGYNKSKNWREDGFCIAFDTSKWGKEKKIKFADEDTDDKDSDERDMTLEKARESVLNLAKQFDQGAIFEYTYSPSTDTNSDAVLIRRTVPALSSDIVQKIVKMTRVSSIPDDDKSELLQRSWLGPKDLLNVAPEKTSNTIENSPPLEFKNYQQVLAGLGKTGVKQKRSINYVKK